MPPPPTITKTLVAFKIYHGFTRSENTLLQNVKMYLLIIEINKVTG